MKVTNPSFNYDKYGHQYSGQRQADPRIAAFIYHALGDAKTVLNVGAGGGSYEPEDRYVVAVEPSVTMRAQRAGNKKVPAVVAKADSLPFDDKSFDAVTAFVTIHHWPDIKAGLLELRRVARQRVVLLTFDPDGLKDYWNDAYFPELVEIEEQRFPTIDFIKDTLGGQVNVQHVVIPFDCTDGFMEAYYGRPEAFLSEDVRKAQSAWGFVSAEKQEEMVKRLADDLQSGRWDKKYGHLRTQPTYTGSLLLIVADL